MYFYEYSAEVFLEDKGCDLMVINQVTQQGLFRSFLNCLLEYRCSSPLGTWRAPLKGVLQST
jgi:hypothetical protein